MSLVVPSKPFSSKKWSKKKVRGEGILVWREDSYLGVMTLIS